MLKFVFLAIAVSATPGVTTHVLNTSTGGPGKNMAINVFYQCNDKIRDFQWSFLKKA